MRKGFNLVELIIVVAIIAILAGMVSYNVIMAKVSSNETTAITHLRLISVLQSEIQIRSLIDQDGDTIGEYALLGELCGTVPIRGLNQKESAISNLYGPKAGAGHGEKDGYCFQIFLPSPAGSPVVDDGTNSPTVVKDNADLQENYYRCYAWPIQAGKTGNRAFAIDHNKNVYSTANLGTDGKPFYSGATKKPAYNSASPSGDTSEFINDLGEGTGNDGLTWNLVK